MDTEEGDTAFARPSAIPPARVRMTLTCRHAAVVIDDVAAPRGRARALAARRHPSRRRWWPGPIRRAATVLRTLLTPIATAGAAGTAVGVSDGAQEAARTAIELISPF